METQIRGRWLAIFAMFAWMAVMFQFSTQLWTSAHTKAILEMLLSAPFLPDLGASSDHLNFVIRKAAHFTEYAVLAGVGYGAAVLGFQKAVTRSLQLTLAGTILFAISDEWHQLFVPGRTSTPKDVCLDIAGACFVVVAIATWQQRNQAKIPPRNSTTED